MAAMVTIEEEKWDGALALARAKLKRKREETRPPPEDRIGSVCGTSFGEYSLLIATYLWLDELGEHFGCLLVGHVFQYYDTDKFDMFSDGLMNEANASGIAETLKRANQKLKTLSCITPETSILGDRSQILIDMVQKLQPWKETRWYCGITRQLALWKVAWDPKVWSIMENRRMAAFSEFKNGAEALMITAKALSYEPKYEDDWLESETRALLGLDKNNPQSKTHVPLPFRATPMKRNVPYIRLDHRKWEGKVIQVQDEMNQVQAEMKLLIESLQQAVSNSQSNLRNQYSESCKLENDVSRLQAEKEALEEAAASDCLLFEEEKVLLLQRFDEDKAQLQAITREEARACIICLAKPHNLILFPCSHAHYCEDCVETFRKTSNTCPTCRTVITGAPQSFRSSVNLEYIDNVCI